MSLSVPTVQSGDDGASPLESKPQTAPPPPHIDATIPVHHTPSPPTDHSGDDARPSRLDPPPTLHCPPTDHSGEDTRPPRPEYTLRDPCQASHRHRAPSTLTNNPKDDETPTRRTSQQRSSCQTPPPPPRRLATCQRRQEKAVRKRRRPLVNGPPPTACALGAR